MATLQTSYLSPKLTSIRLPQKGGSAVIAGQPIARGELLVVWGGKVVPAEQFYRLPQNRRRYAIQVEEQLYMVSPSRPEPADFINHSCDPTAGMSGQIALVALRDITPGEEICYDYCMSDGSPYDEFECACGSASCRGWITGDDWKIPELQIQYAGYFSPYIQRRIDQFRVRPAPREPELTTPAIGEVWDERAQAGTSKHRDAP